MFLIFPLYIPWKHIFLVFWCFQGYRKETLRKNGFMNEQIHYFSIKKIRQAMTFPWLRKFSARKEFFTIKKISRKKIYFHKQRLFDDQGSFSWLNKFFTSMDFSMIKKIFQKPRFFQDQGYFLQAKIFHPCNTSDLRQKYFKTFLRIDIRSSLVSC